MRDIGRRTFTCFHGWRALLAHPPPPIGIARLQSTTSSASTPAPNSAPNPRSLPKTSQSTKSHSSPPPLGRVTTSTIRASFGPSRILNEATSVSPSVRRHPLTLKRLRESYLEAFLFFKSDPVVREEYINQFNGVQQGKILEDLDALAGAISYRHCSTSDGDSASLPYVTIVTASVDRLDLISRPKIDSDLKMSGMVTYVGHSSMGVTLTIESIDQDMKPVERIAVARFTMVARDPRSSKAVQVNPLVIETDEDRALFRQAMEFKERKESESKTQFHLQPPTSSERILIHQLYLASLKQTPDQASDSVKFISDTRTTSTEICYPQDRNIHNFIFGGHLMRKAFEIAYVCACQFAKGRPYLLGMDDLTFLKPVPIGSILEFQAKVVYATDRSFQIKASTLLINTESGQKEKTNTFHFSFTIHPNQCGSRFPEGHTSNQSKPEPNRLATLLPRTYAESMDYLDGKRRWERARCAASEAGSRLAEEY